MRYPPRYFDAKPATPADHDPAQATPAPEAAVTAQAPGAAEASIAAEAAADADHPPNLTDLLRETWR